MITLYIAIGVVVVIGGLVYALQRMAKAEQRAADEAEAISIAKETEDAMDEITGQPRDPEKTKRELDEGTF